MRGHRLSALLLSVGGFLCLLWGVLLLPDVVEARPPLQATDEAPGPAQSRPLTLTVMPQDQNGNAILRVEPAPALTQTILLFFQTQGLDLASPNPQWPISPTLESSLRTRPGVANVIALGSQPISISVVVSETYAGVPLAWQLLAENGQTVIAAQELGAQETALLMDTVPPAQETLTPTATATTSPTVAPSATPPPPTPPPTASPPPATPQPPPPTTEAAPAVVPLATDEPDGGAGGGLLEGLGSRNLLLIALIALLMLLLILLLVYLLFRLFAGSPPPPTAAPVPAGPPPAPPGSPVLLFGENGRAVPIDDLPFSIGRAEDNNLAIRASDHPAAATVSRHHALIERQGGEFVITDRGSQNGIQVNDRPTPRNLLRDGWRVSIGGVPFTFYTQPPGESGGASR